MAVETCLLTQLPSDAWFEGMVARPSGDLLLARVDQPQLYSLSTADPEAEPEVLYTFPEDVCTGVINLCELAGCPDEYILLTGRVDLAQVQADSFVLWRVRLGAAGTPPAVTKVAELPQAGLALDVAAASPRTVLVCDAPTRSIYAVDVATGASAVFLTDDVFAPAGPDDFFGINTLRVVGAHLWFTNSSRGVLGRLPVRRDPATGELAAAGPVEVLARDVPDCDGFSVAADGRAAYTASPSEGKLWEVAVGAGACAPAATTTVLADQLVNPTAVQLVPAAAAGAPPRLYAVCCGKIDVGWLDADRDPWKDIAVGLKGLTTTVEVTEVVETSGS